jgi:putative ABC transport system permease protein
MLRLFALLNARFAHQRGRSALSIAGIGLGVALGFAVSLVNRAAIDELSAGVRTLAGEADLVVRGGRAGFDESLYARLARLEGVAAASPVLEADAGLATGGGTIRLVGIDSLRTAQLQPMLFADEPGRRIELLRPDAVYLSAAAAVQLGLGAGQKLRIVAGLGIVELEIAGVLPAAALRGVAALADVATVQWRLDRIGQLNRVDLRLAPGTDREGFLARLAPQLPAGVLASTVETAEESGAALSRAYRVNLNVLALVALFTGGFLVFSAQALEVTRRRGEHALLRVLGLERRGVARLVLIEAAAVGAIGGAAGLALGYALAGMALRLAGADLGAGMFRGVAPALGFPVGGALGYFGAGVAIAVAGAWLPARDAARTAPAQALKAGDEQRLFARAAWVWPGVALLATGGLLAQAPALGGIPLAGYLAIACFLVGGTLLMPWLAQAALARLPRVPRVPYLLALAQLRGAPGQAMVSLAAIVASFSLMVAMAIMVASLRHSVDQWLDAVLPADLYFRTTHAGETAWLEPAFERQVRALPQVQRAEFLRSGRITLDPARPPITLIARDAGRDGTALIFPLAGQALKAGPDDPPPAWISEAVADLYGYALGRRIELPLGGRRHAFVVAGIWRDYLRQHGAIVIERERYAEMTGDRRTNDATLWLAPGASAAELIEALRDLPGGEQLEMGTPGEIREASLRLFDRTFAVTYALEAVAVLVGLFGLSSSVAAIVLSRRREFGMLRHLGMTRAQISAMLAAEGGLLALLGVVAGLLLGGLISLVLVYVVNRQSFNWGMELHPPYALLAGLSLLLVGLALLTAYVSGREATGMAPVRAVKDDW